MNFPSPSFNECVWWLSSDPMLHDTHKYGVRASGNLIIGKGFTKAKDTDWQSNFMLGN